MPWSAWSCTARPLVCLLLALVLPACSTRPVQTKTTTWPDTPAEGQELLIWGGAGHDYARHLLAREDGSLVILGESEAEPTPDDDILGRPSGAIVDAQGRLKSTQVYVTSRMGHAVASVGFGAQQMLSLLATQKKRRVLKTAGLRRRIHRPRLQLEIWRSDEDARLERKLLTCSPCFQHYQLNESLGMRKDGSFWYAGWFPEGSARARHFVAAASADGHELWRHDMPLGRLLHGVHPSPDGGLLLVAVKTRESGESRGQHDWLTMRLDAEGKLKWQARHQAPEGRQLRLYAIRYDERSERYWLLGHAARSSEAPERIWRQWVDENGLMGEAETLRPLSVDDGSVRKIAFAAANSYLVASQTHDMEGSAHLQLRRWNMDGRLEAEYQLSHRHGHFGVAQVMQHTDGRIWLIGSRSSDDESGTQAFLWTIWPEIVDTKKRRSSG